MNEKKISRRKHLINEIEELAVDAKKSKQLKVAMDGFAKIVTMEGHDKSEDDPHIIKLDTRRMTKEQLVLLGLDGERKEVKDEEDL